MPVWNCLFLFCEKKALPKAGAGWGVLADVLPCFDAAVPPVSSRANDREPTGTVPVGVGRLVCWSERPCTGCGQQSVRVSPPLNAGLTVLPGLVRVDGWAVLALVGADDVNGDAGFSDCMRD